MKSSPILQSSITRFGPLVFIILLVAWLITGIKTTSIDSFAACKNAGYPVLEMNPPVCQGPGSNFNGPYSTPALSSATVTNISFDLLVDGNSGGNYPRGWQQITTQKEWEEYWANVHASVTLPPLLPVDFSASDVIAVSEGIEPISGYKMVVSNISASPTGSVVHLTETTPVGCGNTPSENNPYFLVKSPKLVSPVTYKITQATHSCMKF